MSLRERRSGVLPIGGEMSETPAVYGQTQSRRRFAKSDDNGSSSPRARAEHKKTRAIRRGNPDRPLGCW
jgi:hypothetical protein